MPIVSTIFAASMALSGLFTATGDLGAADLAALVSITFVLSFPGLFGWSVPAQDFDPQDRPVKGRPAFGVYDPCNLTVLRQCMARAGGLIGAISTALIGRGA